MDDANSLVRPVNSRYYPWYDSVWLSAYQRARAVIRAVAPGRLAEFERAFDALRTAPDFKIKFFDQVFDPDTLAEIRRITASLSAAELELHEARLFRRFIVHDQPFFGELQRRILGLASEAAGEPLAVTYNFLSLYGPQGICPLHLDAPSAKWTLDVCIDQSAEWPIHFGPVSAWPQPGVYGRDWEAQVKAELAGRFSSYSLRPGQAVFFSGSSQWHYRDAMPEQGGAGFCDLLFFHFIPAASAQVVEPSNWAGHFCIPELADGEFALPG